jgi:hypothetical protein
MGIRKTATALLGFGLLLGVYTPAWSAESTTPAASAQTAQTSPYGNSLMGMLNSVLTGTTTDPRQPEKHCQPGHLYSQHDVVGDPETCIMGRYTVPGGGTAPIGVP